MERTPYEVLIRIDGERLGMHAKFLERYYDDDGALVRSFISDPVPLDGDEWRNVLDDVTKRALVAAENNAREVVVQREKRDRARRKLAAAQSQMNALFTRPDAVDRARGGA